MVNLCFMALEDKKKVTSTSYSSCDDCNYNDDDDESFIMSKLMLKCTSLLSKKKLYKHELSNLSKKFKKLNFSKLIESNAKLANDLKS